MRALLVAGLITAVLVAGGIVAFYTSLQQPAGEVMPESTTSPPRLVSTATPSGVAPAVPTKEVVEPLKLRSIRDFFSNFSHMKLVATRVNGSEVAKVVFEYRVVPGGVVAGEQARKVDVTVTNPAGESQTLTFWLTMNYSTVLKIAAPDGTTYEGASAAQLGHVLLSQLNMFLIPLIETENINYVISESEVPAEIPGWVIASSEQGTAIVGGRDYPAYAVALRNVNDSASQTSLINVKIAELEEELWLVTYIKVLMKDRIMYEYVIVELETHAR